MPWAWGLLSHGRSSGTQEWVQRNGFAITYFAGAPMNTAAMLHDLHMAQTSANA
jgi:hypothetical protein